MEVLSQVLPILIYFLLIAVIIVGIILGIKLIITLDKVDKLVDDVQDKVNKVTPIFDTVGLVSEKVNGIFGTIVSSIEGIIYRLFTKNKNNDDMESEEDE